MLYFKKFSLTTLLLFISLGLLSGCGANQVKSEQDKASGDEQTEEAFVPDYPSKALLEFAYEVENELTYGEGASLSDKVDTVSFRTRGRNSYQLGGFFIGSLMMQLDASIVQHLIADQLGDLRNHYKRFTLVSHDAERSKLLYRLEGNRLDYLEVYYRRYHNGNKTSDNQDYLIVDFRRWSSIIPESIRLSRIALLSGATKKGKSRKTQKANLSKLPTILKSKNAQEIQDFFGSLDHFTQKSFFRAIGRGDLVGGLFNEERQKHFLQILEASALLANTQDKSEYKKLLKFLNLRDQPFGDASWVGVYASNSDPYRAISFVDQVLANDFNDAAILELKATIERQSERYDDALESAYQALALDPQYQKTYWTLASELVRRNEMDIAWDSFKVLRSRFGRLITENTLKRHSSDYDSLLAQPEFIEWLRNPS